MKSLELTTYFSSILLQSIWRVGLFLRMLNSEINHSMWRKKVQNRLSGHFSFKPNLQNINLSCNSEEWTNLKRSTDWLRQVKNLGCVGQISDFLPFAKLEQKFHKLRLNGEILIVSLLYILWCVFNTPSSSPLRSKKFSGAQGRKQKINNLFDAGKWFS